jgi:hypothetical protein
MAGLAVLAGGCSGPAKKAASGGDGLSASSGRYGFASARAGSPTVSPAYEPARTGSRSGVTGGALFGGNSPLAQQEAKLGRKLAIIRVYYRIGEKFPKGAQERRLMAAGSTLLVSLDTVPGSGPSYASIVAGHQDAAIGAFLRAVNQAAVSYHLGAIYISFEHEADDPRHLVLGSPSQFIRAWDHVHQLAQSEHLDWAAGGRLHWVLILLHQGYYQVLPSWLRLGQGGASSYWPGTGEVDIVAADGYNSHGCHSSRPGEGAAPVTIFAPVVSFAAAHGLPVFIAEWGIAPNGSGAQPAFIHLMQDFVAGNREIAAVMYWDSGPNCHYSIDEYPASVAAMAAMGHAAALQGRVALAH